MMIVLVLAFTRFKSGSLMENDDLYTVVYNMVVTTDG